MSVLQPLIAPERIMQIMDVKPRYFWEVIALDPAFPKPVLAESRKMRRYYEIEIEQFINDKAAKFRNSKPH